MDAKVAGDRPAVTCERVHPYRSPLPPLRASQARAAHPDPDGNRWAQRFATGLSGNPLGPFHTGTRLASEHAPDRTVPADPDDEIDRYRWPWHGDRVLSLAELPSIPFLPLRHPSPPEHTRVKAYRKQSREGVLPPVVAWWISGLFVLAVVDGHDRLVAALAEDRPPRVITFGLAVSGDVVDGEVSRAVQTYDTAVDLASRYPFDGAIDAADRSLTATVTAAGLRYGPTRAFPIGEGDRPRRLNLRRTHPIAPSRRITVVATRSITGDRRHPAVEVVRPAVDPSAVIITAHGGRARGTGVPHRGRLTYLRMVPFSRMWNDLPQVAVWRLRYRYTGWNGGMRAPVADLEWALETAKQRYPDAKAVLVGHSMGGRAALMAAGADNVAAVCALAPWIEPTDPVAQLRGRRVLIAHGDRDLITDPVASSGYADWARELGVDVEHRTVAGSGHTMLSRRATWRSLTAEFVAGVVRALPQRD